MTTYLITGANRGIGLELVRQLSLREGVAVVGTARDVESVPGEARRWKSVRWVALNVADPASIEGLAGRVAAAVGELGRVGVDVLLNNAGVSSTAKSLADLTAAELHRVFAVNAFAPLLVARAMRGMMEGGSGVGKKLIVNVSSQLASIANNSGGSSYPYRASKSALNQLTVSLANELRPAGFTCLAVHPGWVRTDMGGSQAPLSPEQSARHLLELIDRAGPEHSGKFLNYDGKPLPW